MKRLTYIAKIYRQSIFCARRGIQLLMIDWCYESLSIKLVMISFKDSREILRTRYRYVLKVVALRDKILVICNNKLEYLIQKSSIYTN